MIYALLLAATPNAPATPDSVSHWYDLIVTRWEHGGLELRFGLLGILVVVAAFVGLRFLLPFLLRRPSAFGDTASIKIKFGSLFEQEIKPNHDTVRIAYQAWVETTTRKVGLPLEEENDVIEEVYNSWYAVFGILRELAKSIPAHRLRQCEDTRQLVIILQRVLNEGLRPHLTRWQARFRRWYETAKQDEANKDKSPQEIQRDFPGYDELVKDLKEVNQQFVEFASTLKQLAEGRHE